MKVCGRILSLDRNLPQKYFQGFFFFHSKPQEIAPCTAANKFPQYQESNWYNFWFKPKKDIMAWILGRLEN